ncbi:ABC transporter ATP-binding protein [Arenicella chitinivorans]|uniref:ABC transporter ATP-binding protein n=1 Tax=Arenicella chitinivorans TaxID=1329800 RepID=A0A918VHI2_9GAMM|nr:ATP-binding cassette domain-containing protein [Arenicella chitinivorans]GGZ97168.1 ABC transporter ATP-binding protein [Arenicella chitinivorans]
MIQANNLKKYFGAVKAVDGVSFSAENGKITGLLGPNGAGKSTTLRMLYTAFKPDSGSATIDQFDITREAESVRASIGVLTHGAGIYERLSARENVRYFGELHGLTGAALNKRIDQLAELLEMQDFIDRRAKGFSQGQKTKVALARALVHGPRNVLLDEPTNGLDVMATRGLRKVIQRLKDEGHCVLFSSHVMQEVAALCDQIVIISGGLVAANGTPDELRASTGKDNLEDAFVSAIGSEEGLV